MPNMPGEQPEQPEPNEQANEPEPNGSAVRLLSYADAAPLLGISPDAVRMRCRRGRLVCGHGPDGAGVVWPQPAPAEQPAEQPNRARTNERTAEQPNEQGERGSVRSPGSARIDAERDAAALAERVVQLAARLAAAETDRDRWADEAAGLRTLLQQAQAMALAERDRADAIEARAALALPEPPGVLDAAGDAPTRPQDAPRRAEPAAPASPAPRPPADRPGPLRRVLRAIRRALP